jgi:XTP/dITP diphosphohydrolase
MPGTIVMASSNAGKIKELSRLLKTLHIDLVAQSELGVVDAEETGTSFAENSLLKARHACKATGLPAIADDSGLAVDVLDGAPGVFSARYAGVGASDDANIDKLLLQMDGSSERSAAFHCVATLVLPNSDDVLTAAGVWHGRILLGRTGRGGFGYDPIFFDPESGCSAAQLGAAEKNATSHRGQAIRGLVTEIEQRFS